MKQLSLSFFSLLLFAGASAQITSTACLEDIKKVYTYIDHERLMAGAEQMRIPFQHQYIMRHDEEGKTISHEETMVLGPKFLYYETPEFTECSDGGEAFNYRKYQYLIYRTQSTLSKSASIIPGMDKGIFAHCLVKECAFVDAPGKDTLHYKRAYMTVSEEGQKKYLIKDLEFIWNPLNQQPVTAGVTFTEKSIWKWARWDFHGIAKLDLPMPGDVKGNLYDANGEVHPRFKGAEVLDYR